MVGHCQTRRRRRALSKTRHQELPRHRRVVPSKPAFGPTGHRVHDGPLGNSHAGRKGRLAVSYRVDSGLAGC
jgi:hypothetical protein